MRPDLVGLYLALPRSGKAYVLARLAHEETIHARGAYLEQGGPISGELLRRSNEYVHRITGHIGAVLSGHATPDRDASFMGIVIEIAARRGTDELERLASWLLAAREEYGSEAAAPCHLAH